MNDLTAAIEAIEPWAKAFDQTGGPGTHLRVLITAARASQEAAAETAALRKDAERYRWMRRNPTWIGYEHDVTPENVDKYVDQDIAAHDAAISASAPDKEGK